MSYYYVYLLLDPRKFYLPFYVGKGRNGRANSHFTESARGENRHKDAVISAIKEIGSHPVVLYWATGLSEQDAYSLEKELIARFGRKHYDEGGILTNVLLDARPPSALGRVITDDVREKISSAQRGEKNHRWGVRWSEEEKVEKRAKALEVGNRPPVLRGPMPQEQKDKISKANKGRKWSAESRARASQERMGKKRGRPSDETIQKLREANLGKKKRPRTEIEKLLISERSKKYWAKKKGETPDNDD